MNEKLFIDSIIKVLEKDSRLIDLGITTNFIKQEILKENYRFDILWNVSKNNCEVNFIIDIKMANILNLSSLQNFHNNFKNINIKNKIAMFLFTNEISNEAVIFAEKNKIILVKMQPDSEEDWKGRLKEISINMFIMSPSFYNYKLNVDKEKTKIILEKNNKQNFAFNFAGKTTDLLFKNGDGNIIYSLQDILENYSKNINEEIEKHIKHDFNEEVFIDSDIGPIPILSVEFDMKITKINHPIIVSAKNDLGFPLGFSIIKKLKEISDLDKFIVK